MGLWWPDTLSKFKWTSTPSKPDPASSKSSSAATRSKRSRDTRTSLLLQPGLLEPHAHLLRPSSCPAPPLPHLQMPFQSPTHPSGPPCSFLLEVCFIFVPCCPLPGLPGGEGKLCASWEETIKMLYLSPVFFFCANKLLTAYRPLWPGLSCLLSPPRRAPATRECNVISSKSASLECWIPVLSI